MNIRRGLIATAILLVMGCSSAPRLLPPDKIETQVAAPLDQVKTALAQVLTEGGYDVTWSNDRSLITGYREEIHGPWNWLYLWRFGTIKSRVQASIAAETDHSTALKLEVLSERKDGIFSNWEEAPSALPQSANHQLRLVKNALQLP